MCHDDPELTSNEYDCFSTLILHLYQSHISNTWEGTRVCGDHTKAMQWRRSNPVQLIPNINIYACPYDACTFTSKRISDVNTCVIKQLKEDQLDLTESEVWEVIKNYFQHYHNYVISDEEIAHTKQA
jgi:hypothetical protein